MVTVALGRAAPLGSVTVPSIRPVVVCENRGRQNTKMPRMKPKSRLACIGNRIRCLQTWLWTAMVIDNKAWSDSLTAVVRQLYHSSKATVKQLSVLGVARGDSEVECNYR